MLPGWLQLVRSKTTFWQMVGRGKEAFAGFLQGKTLSANQIEFVDMIIDNLAESGWIDPARLYEAPYTRFSARGVDGLFPDPDIVSLLDILDTVRQRAVA